MTEFPQLPDRILGLPVGKEVSIEALVKDVWNPETEDLFPPKSFLGLGFGVNFYAIARKTGIL
ncbi:hypothetical protein AB3N59_13085 [Leptospira sp. WS92.C1]